MADTSQAFTRCVAPPRPRQAGRTYLGLDLPSSPLPSCPLQRPAWRAYLGLDLAPTPLPRLAATAPLQLLQDGCG